MNLISLRQITESELPTLLQVLSGRASGGLQMITPGLQALTSSVTTSRGQRKLIPGYIAECARSEGACGARPYSFHPQFYNRSVPTSVWAPCSASGSSVGWGRHYFLIAIEWFAPTAVVASFLNRACCSAQHLGWLHELASRANMASYSVGRLGLSPHPPCSQPLDLRGSIDLLEVHHQ